MVVVAGFGVVVADVVVVVVAGMVVVVGRAVVAVIGGDVGGDVTALPVVGTVASGGDGAVADVEVGEPVGVEVEPAAAERPLLVPEPQAARASMVAADHAAAVRR